MCGKALALNIRLQLSWRTDSSSQGSSLPRDKGNPSGLHFVQHTLLLHSHREGTSSAPHCHLHKGKPPHIAPWTGVSSSPRQQQTVHQNPQYCAVCRGWGQHYVLMTSAHPHRKCVRTPAGHCIASWRIFPADTAGKALASINPLLCINICVVHVAELQHRLCFASFQGR